MNNVVQNKSKIFYQLQKLRRLAQPFFLPIDQCNGFQFIWLLISLLFCVGGIVLVVLTGYVPMLRPLSLRHIRTSLKLLFLCMRIIP